MSYNYGYVRVSTKDQNVARQVQALEELQLSDLRVYIDKQSGKNFDRPEYKKLLRKIEEDDVLYIKSIDRLGRNYDEIIEQWRILTKQKGVDIVVLDMPLLDTRENGLNGTTGKFIGDLVLQILSYVADIERQFIKQRQAEGIKIAREKGVRFGRPQKDIPQGYKEAKKEYLNGNLSAREAALQCGVPKTTFLRWIKKI